MTDKEIAEIYRQMELEIIASMKRNLALHEAEEEETGLKYPQWQAEKLRSLRQYRKENKRIFAKYTKKLPAEVQKQLKSELKQGYSHEIEKYRSIIGEDRYRSAMAMKDSFFSINTRKADALIKEIKGSLFKANAAALRMADDTYRQVITKAELFLTNGVYTEKQAYDMAVRDFLERGLNCIEYKDGRRVNIDDYASMAVRTASQRAYLIGEGEFRKQTGRTLIIISRHNTSCEKCRPFESKVLIDDVYSGGKADDGDYMLLSTAMSLGLFHPRCRHGCGTYFPELEDITGYDRPDNRLNDYGEYDKAGNVDKAVQRHQHAQRMVQKYTRLTVGSADEQNIAKYQKRLDYWQEQEKALSQDTVDGIRIRSDAQAREIILREWEEYRLKFLNHAVPIDFSKLDSLYSDMFSLEKFKDKNIVEQIYSTTAQLSGKYYSPLQRIEWMSAEESKLNTAFASSNHMWEQGSASMRFNPAKINEKGIKRLRELSDNGYSVRYAPGKEIEYVTTHEFGHTILNSGEKLPGKSRNFVEADYSAVKNARKEIDEIWKSYVKDVTDKTEAYEKIRKQLDSKMIFESVQPTKEELKALQEAKRQLDSVKISKYSMKNKDEFIAEAFTDARIGENPKEASKQVHEVINKYFGKKTVANNEKSGIISSGSGNMVEYQTIGKLNVKPLEKEFGKLKTNEVVLTNERVEHIKKRHFEDYDLFFDYISPAVENPDEIIKDLKNENTVFYIKRLQDTNLGIIVKLSLESDNPKIKNSIMTFYRIRNKNLKKLENKNKILYKSE